MQILASTKRFLKVFLPLVFLAGCVGAMIDARTSKNPTYEQVSHNNPIAVGQGRLIVYSPNLTAADDLEQNPGQLIFSAALAGVSEIFFYVDQRVYTDILDGQFTFIDLAPGNHTVRYATGLTKREDFSFTIAQGQTTYLRFSKYAPRPSRIPAATGFSEVSKLNSIYPDGRPFDDCRRMNGEKRSCPMPFGPWTK